MSYAGQRKTEREIEEKLKKSTYSKKSKDSKDKLRANLYYEKLKRKNKSQVK